MKQELLLRMEIPHSTQRGKSKRKLWTNYLMNMHYQKYNRLHSEWKKLVRPDMIAAYREKAFGHINETKYIVTLGFYSGKSTRNCDIDGLFILNKWWQDLLIEVTPIPQDNIHVVVESRCKYLGRSNDGRERVVAQLTKIISE